VDKSAVIVIFVVPAFIYINLLYTISVTPTHKTLSKLDCK